ncbi:unnamed protein product [Orchesella dallaii]|uniref:Uncharacterized protein n=1 Tax=Orchesella dallaii TaxID=48710 RepID=A0ABP1QAT2_9HEXA
MHGQHMVIVKPALAICLARAELLFRLYCSGCFGKPWETASLTLPSSLLWLPYLLTESRDDCSLLTVYTQHTFLQVTTHIWKDSFLIILMTMMMMCFCPLSRFHSSD